MKKIPLPAEKLLKLTISQFVKKLKAVNKGKIPKFKLEFALAYVPPCALAYGKRGEFKTFGAVPVQRIVAEPRKVLKSKVPYIGVKGADFLIDTITSHGIKWNS